MPSRQDPASKADRIAPPVTEAAAKFELASVPLPLARPEFDPAPKQTVQPAHHTERASRRADRKSKTNAQRSFASKPETDSKLKFGDPASVVTFLKKLITPDKKPSRAVEAQADPPSQAKPLQ
jgi:hypothetical protein